MRKHQGLKQWQCTICNKGFAKQGTLKMHMEAIHYDPAAEKPQYICDMCGKVYWAKVSTFVPRQFAIYLVRRYFILANISKIFLHSLSAHPFCRRKHFGCICSGFIWAESCRWCLEYANTVAKCSKIMPNSTNTSMCIPRTSHSNAISRVAANNLSTVNGYESIWCGTMASRISYAQPADYGKRQGTSFVRTWNIMIRTWNSHVICARQFSRGRPISSGTWTLSIEASKSIRVSIVANRLVKLRRANITKWPIPVNVRWSARIVKSDSFSRLHLKHIWKRIRNDDRSIE